MAEIIYILTNEAMPGLIKIGLTTTTIAQRMRELDTSSVPLPFTCYYAATVTDASSVERKLHNAFGDHRVRSSREFFRLDPFRAKSALELAAIEDVTPRNDIIDTADDEKALQKATERRERFNFAKVGIAPNSILTFSRDPNISAVVLNERDVMFNGAHTSLSASAISILRELGYRWSTVAGPDYWIYDGETLSERRLRLEDENRQDQTAG